MAVFLDTMEISSSLQSIIKKSRQILILVSPFIDICDRYKSLIEEKNSQGIHVIIVWGKKKNQFRFDDEEKAWIKSMENVQEIYYKDLHAKCYLNENEAIITSMNLYEASQKNIEMGILLNKEEDKVAYKELLEEIQRLISKDSNLESNNKVIHQSSEGFCIRCSEKIKLNTKHPYCKKDYESWKRYEDDNYSEENGFCHICGEKFKPSMKKPVCRDCYNKNKILFK